MGLCSDQFPNWIYQQGEVADEKRRQLLLFTDGLVEAGNAHQEAFGEENLIRVARESSGCTAESLMHILILTASEHCGGNVSGRCQSDCAEGNLTKPHLRKNYSGCRPLSPFIAQLSPLSPAIFFALGAA